MTEALAAAREQVREAVRELKALSFRLQGVRASLPPSPEEFNLRDLLEEMDPVTELRTVLDDVLRQWIAAAIKDLEAVAEEPAEGPQRRAEKGGMP